jgi:hypothetical protein
VCFKIIPELPRAQYNRIANLFHFRVKILGPHEDLRHEVHLELLLRCFVFVLDFLLDNQGSANRRVRGGDVQNEGLSLFWTQ